MSETGPFLCYARPCPNRFPGIILGSAGEFDIQTFPVKEVILAGTVTQGACTWQYSFCFGLAPAGRCTARRQPTPFINLFSFGETYDTHCDRKTASKSI